jgi:hypothetical protein
MTWLEKTLIYGLSMNRHSSDEIGNYRSYLLALRTVANREGNELRDCTLDKSLGKTLMERVIFPSYRLVLEIAFISSV